MPGPDREVGQNRFGASVISILSAPRWWDRGVLFSDACHVAFPVMALAVSLELIFIVDLLMFA